MHITFLRNLKEIYLGIAGRIMLNASERNSMRICDLDTPGSGLGTVMDIYKHSNKPLNFI